MSIARSALGHETVAGLLTGRRLAPVSPGAVLLEEFIQPLGLTRSRVARAMGVQQRRIDDICAGRRAITAETAVRLGLAFGMDPRFWLDLQAQHPALAEGAARVRRDRSEFSRIKGLALGDGCDRGDPRLPWHPGLGVSMSPIRLGRPDVAETAPTSRRHGSGPGAPL